MCTGCLQEAFSSFTDHLPKPCAPSTFTKQSGSLTGRAVPAPRDLLQLKAGDN